MNKESILRLLHEQDLECLRQADTSLPDVLMKEFIMTDVMKGYLNYFLKNKDLNLSLYNSTAQECLGSRNILIKKAAGFQICKHTNKMAMYLHKHTYIELDYVYKGSCRYYIGNTGSSFLLKEKELCMINQHVIHGLEAAGDNDIIFKCFIPIEYLKQEDFNNPHTCTALKEFAEYTLCSQRQYEVRLTADMRQRKKFENILFDLFSELFEKEAGWRHAYTYYTFLLMTELARIPEEKCVLTVGRINNDAKMMQLLNCIEKNYQYITLKALADDFHFQENYLGRKIKKLTDRNFNELVQEYRLKEAERLLQKTDLSVEKISARIGYSTPAYFYKLFRTRYHMTPVEFRSKIK
jgi:AraC-like DNA-binding protein